MIRLRSRTFAHARIAAAAALFIVIALGACGFAAAAEPAAAPAQVAGRVLDAQTGLPLSGVSVEVTGRRSAATSDAAGTFRIDGLEPGTYRLHLSRAGYQPVDSDELSLPAGRAVSVALTLQAAPSGTALTVIGRTSVTAAGSLQKASTIYRTISAETLASAGVTRAGDALRQLPAINNAIAGDSGAPAYDLYLNLRGIGALETLTTIDGHPIGLGVRMGYNYQMSPTAILRNVTVTYGSGSNLYGTGAIGGVIDLQTLEPTVGRQFSVSQGIGSFDKSATTLQATGTSGRFGYAAAYGVSGLDGPLKDAALHQTRAAYDQSAPPGSAAYALGAYRADSSALARSGLLKLRYAPSDHSSVTFTSLASSYWFDKTGNGDVDYLNYAPALAFGNALLRAYDPKTYPKLAPCPPGTFVATNANGAPNGFGPDGKPDGGTTCQTPAQYAAFNTGYNGFGPAWASFTMRDHHLGYTGSFGRHLVRADLFTNRYANTIDRHFAEPFVRVPGDSPGAFTVDFDVSETGAGLSETLLGANNDVGIGYTYLNVASEFRYALSNGLSATTPIVRETGFLVHDAYHPQRSNLTAYLDVGIKRATATQSSYIDPRASLVYLATPRDVVRISGGATTTQPSGDVLDQPFLPSPPGTLGGGTGITCGGLNSIGSAPSTLLRPERGVDAELAYGHRFARDTQVQLTLYDVNVYDKLYQTIVPLSRTGTGFVDPQFLAKALAAVSAKCGAAAAPSLLGITGTFNVGQLRARGFMLGGRQRLSRRTFIDYDWTLDSTILVSVPSSVLRSNLTLIQGGQLPRLPLHTLTAALDHTFGRGIGVRYTLHAVSVNNTKSLPAYDYSDLRIDAPLGHGALAVSVSNLFRQYADVRGVRYEGVPLPLNGYATPAAYLPYLGASATQRFGLPERTVFVNFTIRSR